MKEQMRARYSERPSWAVAEDVVQFAEFATREQAWLGYQRWRYRHGQLTEFPDAPGLLLRAGVSSDEHPGPARANFDAQPAPAADDPDRQPVPVVRPARRFGWRR